MTEYRLLGAGIRRPSRVNNVVPDPFIELKIMVGKNSRYTPIVLTEEQAIRTIAELSQAILHFRGVRL